VAQAEGLLDHFLMIPIAISAGHQSTIRGNTYGLGLHTGHHVNVLVVLI
jgi:hypothetical protein